MIDEHNLNSFNVSRETIEVLNKYVKMLKKWNNAINLISKSSISNIWRRHIEDSAQLIRFLNLETKFWVDLGSGAGFPGLVVSILAKTNFPELQTILIESDKRKCVFLDEVSRELELNVTVIPDRIEDCSNLKADIVSARALAPMKQLLSFFDMHSKIGSKGLFLKGKNLRFELNEIKDFNNFHLKINHSKINDNSFIVEVNKRGSRR